jgi:hypothetical protein
MHTILVETLIHVFETHNSYVVLGTAQLSLSSNRRLNQVDQYVVVLLLPGTELFNKTCAFAESISFEEECDDPLRPM